jgi:mono/diheme cytochrome c family protein
MPVRLALGLVLAAAPALAEEAGDPAEGREVFLQAAEPQCSVCHTLSDAGSAGEIGPNLDAMELTPERVHAAVTQGLGVMPAYEGVLTPEQIEAVAAYVASVSQGGG